MANPAASAEFRKLPNKRKVKDGDAFAGIGVNSMAEAFQWRLHLVRACASEYGDACVDRLARNLSNATWFSQYSAIATFPYFVLPPYLGNSSRVVLFAGSPCLCFQPCDAIRWHGRDGDR